MHFSYFYFYLESIYLKLIEFFFVPEIPVLELGKFKKGHLFFYTILKFPSLFKPHCNKKIVGLPWNSWKSVKALSPQNWSTGNNNKNKKVYIAIAVINSNIFWISKVIAD